MNAIWKYYIDSAIFNLGFSTLIGLYFGIFWGLVIFGSFGTIISIISFSYFKKKEYYFYYNLGYTKNALILKVWIINILIAIPCLGLYILIINLM